VDPFAAQPTATEDLPRAAVDGGPGPATAVTAARNRRLAQELPDDAQDLVDARRGLIGSLDPPVVHTADGRTAWDATPFAFLDGDAPATVNPSLWRQSRLTAIQGLFEVVPGVYQVRGLDLSNVSFLEGEHGVIVVDPLISAETAAVALALYRRHRGDRPVTGVIFTHSHVDHFGGVHGVLPPHGAAGDPPVIAPAGFLAHATSENVVAGPAMTRRAVYMYGDVLPPGPRGQVGAGLGLATSRGTIGVVAPTVDVVTTGQEEVVDGLRLQFQLAPDSEAPAEMHVYVPERRALCIAENATHTLHNVLTLRGAPVRDARAWAGYLTEAIDRFGPQLEVVFASHHWPTWGRERAVAYLGLQRDLYAYLHDQTVRLMNRGLTGTEIAEVLTLPPALDRAWHARGYYGTVSHDVKAIYQRYLGWYDGVPARLWRHPPGEAARRYLDFMGGADAVVDKARASYEQGDYRWVVEVLDHVVFAVPDHAAGRALLADAYEQLGYGAESASWRDAYLTGAHELRHGVERAGATDAPLELLAELGVEELLDALAVRVDGPRCWDEHLAVDVVLPDRAETHHVTLRNGVLTHTSAPRPGTADVVVRVPSGQFVALVTGQLAPDRLAAAGVVIEGDAAVLGRLLAVLETPPPDFAIVTP